MSLQIIDLVQLVLLLFILSLHDLLGAILNDGGGDGGSGSNSHSIRDVRKTEWNLYIHPFPETSARLMVRRIDDTLNITCHIQKLRSGNESIHPNARSPETIFKLAWFLPSSLEYSGNRVVHHEFRNSLQLIIQNLKDSDAGDYKCMAQEIPLGSDDSHSLSTSLTLHIKQRKGSCSETNFACPTGECIAKRFLCDGLPDCKNGDDENQAICGTGNSCEGKLRCNDGRCISTDWCCDRQKDLNCTVRSVPTCCQQLQNQNGLDFNQYPPIQQQFNNDMGFLQTTIYTVIGCAMAFMFIITIMVIAICRVHLKRTALARYPGSHVAAIRQDHGSWGNIFMQSAAGLPYTSVASGLLVTYNINNGIQFMGRNPPPYSEAVRPAPHEPPPPYASTDNLADSSEEHPQRHSNHQISGVDPENEQETPLLESSSTTLAAETLRIPCQSDPSSLPLPHSSKSIGRSN